MTSLLLEEQSGQDYQIAFFIIRNQLEDSILGHTPKEFFPLKYIWDKQYCILFGDTVDTKQLVSDEAV